MSINRLDWIKQHFGYLLAKYGFHIDREAYMPQAMGDAFVIFKSATTGICVAIDRDQGLITLGDLSTPQRDWFEFGDVVNFFEPSITNPYDFSLPLEGQIASLAELLLLCEPFIKGEFWMKDEIKKIERKRAIKEFGKYMNPPLSESDDL